MHTIVEAATAHRKNSCSPLRFLLRLTLTLCALIVTSTAWATVSVSISPSSASLCAGESRPFSATGTPSGCEGAPGAATYQWSVDGSTISGATAATYPYTASGSGSHSLSCTVSFGSCGSNSGSANVTVNSGTITLNSANVSPTSGTVCQNFTFSANATPGCGGSGITYTWDFGDGKTGSGASPTHTYAGPGTYSAKVTASDGSGSPSTSVSVTVTSAPGLTFSSNPSASPASPTTCDSVKFTANASSGCSGSGITYTWDFGDGKTGSGASPTHTYSSPGTYHASVSASDGASSLGKPVDVTVKQGTVLSVGQPTAQPSTPTSCDSVHFSAQPTPGCSSGSLTYDWDFGDGSPHSSATSPSYKYGGGGTYNVTVRVTDSMGATASGSTTLTVTDATPGSPSNLQVTAAYPTYINLTWQAAVPSGASYTVWRSVNGSSFSQLDSSGGTSYQDGSVQASTASQPMSYCYYVTASSICGTQGGTSNTTCATAPCQSNITIQTASASEPVALIGQSVTFTANASDSCGQSLNYTWNFDDGSAAAVGSSVSHAYSTTGSHSVNLEVSDGLTQQSRQVGPVTVYDGVGRNPTPGDPSGGGGPDSGSDGPGQSPGSPHYHHCQQACGGTSLGSTTVCTDTFSGNTRIVRKDPVATRGFPINVNMTLNTETALFNRPAGNGCLTYDIFIGQQNVYDGSCHATMHWFVVDGDGTQNDFGPSTADPKSTYGIFSTLQVLKDNSGIIVGYQLVHAGPPENVKSYGNFTYSFNALGLLVQLTDPHGNAQTLSYASNGGTGSPRVQKILDVSTQKAVTFDYVGNYVQHIYLGGGQTVNTFTYLGGNLTELDVKDSLGNTLNAAKYAYNPDNTLATFQKDGNTNSALHFAYTPYPSRDCSQPHANLSTSGAVGSGGAVVFSIKLGNSHPADTADRVAVKNAQGGLVICDYNTKLEMFRMFKPAPIGASKLITYLYTYNADHEITSMSDGISHVSFTYNESPFATNPGTGYMTGVTDNLNNSWTWGWNGADLTSATNPMEAAASVSNTVGYADVNQPHVPTTITDGANIVWTLGHNAHGQITQVTPPDGSLMKPTIIVYDEAAGSSTLGYPQFMTDGNGNKTTFDAYDPEGDLLQTSSYPVPGNSAIRNSVVFTYDSAQRVTKVTLPDNHFTQAVYVGKDLDHTIDEAGIQTNYTYCANCGALTGISGPLGYSLNWAFDADKDLISYTDPNNHTTHYTYGGAEELQFVTYPDNSTLGFLYDESMTLQQITNGRGNKIALGYDGDERLKSVTFPTSNQHPLAYDYNVDGSLKDFSDSIGTTSYSYSVNGWLQSVKYDYSATGLPNIQELDYAYYPDGLRQSVTWKNGTTTVGTWNYGYDAGGRLTSVQNPWSETTGWTYDGEDKLTSQTNANGTSTAYSYNQARGWVTSIGQSAGTTPFASYGLNYDNGANTVGLLTNVTLGDGSSSNYAYDTLYRLTSETALPSVSIANASFEAPSAANAYGGYLFNPSNAGWTFNGSPGNGSGVTTNGSPGLAGGNPNSPYGNQVGFLQIYGSMSQTLSGFQSGANYTVTLAAAQRSGNSQTFQVLLDGNVLGTITPTGTSYQDYSVGPFTTSAGSHTLQLTGIDPQGGDNTVFVDNVHLSATPTSSTPPTHTYGYDLAGNRTGFDDLTVAYDAANKAASTNLGGSFTYDGDGNTTHDQPYNYTSQLPPAFIDARPSWDDLNRMTGISGGNGPGEGYGYDARGLYVAFLPVGNNGPSTGFATFRIYDGSVVLGDVSASSGNTQRTVTVQAAYTWGAAGLVSERLFNQNNGLDKSLWYHFGPQGETRQLTDASGSVADSYSYTSYGLSTATTGGDANPYLYGGQFGYYTSQNWKLVLCGLRWYDPHTGLFLSRDPIDYGGGPNLYAYCDGDPVNMADPSGTTPWWFGRGVPMSSIDPNLYSPETQMNNLDALAGFIPGYNLGTALTGRDAFGRCLSTPDRLLRGISDVLPMLGKLRGLGGFTRLAKEAGCSFAAGTPIVMADGTSRAVETLHAGDTVLAKNEKTGQVEAQEVTATVHHPAPTLVTVTFAGADGKTQAIVCTPEHPFFVDGKGWVEAGSLGIGTSITSRAGPSLSVQAVQWQRSGQAQGTTQQLGAGKAAFTVYNFTVEQDHTFFVGTANGGAWTHNGTCTVLGAWEDTTVAKNWPGHNVLGLPQDKWSWAKNKDFLDQAIDRGDDLYLATDPASHPRWPNSVFRRELNYLANKGFKRTGDYLRR